jgi:hypothetical protein
MSVRNAIVSLLSFSTLLFLAACGSNGGGIANPVAPPSGGFSASNLNGTYVFSISGTDSTGFSYAMVGTFTANGSGGITGGAFDLTDLNGTEFTTGPIPNASIASSSTYHVGVDGRGQATLNTSITNFNPVLDFVLSSNSQGQVTEFDNFGSGSGTLDAQTANVTPTGSYAFSLSGAAGASGNSPWATVGNFTLTGTTLTGSDDLNEAVLLNYADSMLTGTLALGPSTTPSSTLTIGTIFSGTFDVVAIDATHLKYIEMDPTATLSGDAYSQSTTAFPTGTLAFTLDGLTAAGAPIAAGGLMTTGSGDAITGTEDYNVDGSNIPTSPLAFTATYTPDPNDAGRYTLAIPSGTFVGGTTYTAYPSSGGLLLLEVDTAGITVGAGYTQTAGATFGTASEGYGLNLSGINLSQGVEVDDIAEFTANPTGTAITGIIDENYTGADGGQFLSEPFYNSSYTTPANGRGSITAYTGTSSVPGTLNGGFFLTYYPVDGTTYPFIEMDSGQVAAGVFVQQSTPGSSSAIAKTHSMFVPRPLVRPNSARQKKN